MEENEHFVGICPTCNKKGRFAEVLSTRFNFKTGQYTRKRSCVCLTCRAVAAFVNEPVHDQEDIHANVFIERR
ncbi:MAG: hypothetical protein ACFFCS_29570 [Candidatus Hodarchaeota archaeon]